MAKPTLASLMAEIETLKATLASAPVAPASASSHWKTRDLPCLATPRCDKTFRTIKGQTFHTQNTK